MKVISAGFPKTGTKTMTVALQILGFNVYDYMENTTILGNDWVKIFRDGWTTEDFKRMYENVDAVSDLPPSYFWEEIHKAFPEAKIILSIRDEDSWYKSFFKQFTANESSWALKIMSLLSPTGYWSLKIIYDHFIGSVIFGFRDSLLWKPFSRLSFNEQLMKLKYRTHNANVLQNAPPEKLLVYNFHEGWEPLCKFLGVPVPDVPFPHKNKGADILKEYLAKDSIMIKIEKETMFSMGIISVLGCIGGYYVFKKGPRNIWSSVNDVAKTMCQKIRLS
ncbi:uncharacterized protein LOC120334362 [Styela clava]|uniref:uncharacterized protein LOC120334362 n=1 Tax=Styela clava TaxID=7725 RepID=UPI00193A981D|nr:uncharacterized protein LOC120334362 [Styela clava]